MIATCILYKIFILYKSIFHSRFLFKRSEAQMHKIIT